MDQVVQKVTVDVIDIEGQRSAEPCAADAAYCAFVWNVGLKQGPSEHPSIHSQTSWRSSHKNALGIML